ncbi:MAG: hypothetical protein FJ304_06860 [Planctomycetes bacterium]|nr:hypothetical protein [Planctomycetota bacterium]
MRRALLFVALVGLTAGGCGGPKLAKVKGKLVTNDQPMTFPLASAGVIFTPLSAEGTPDPSKAFTAVINEDGTFEMLASGGQLPPGKYQISIQAQGKLKEQLKKFGEGVSPVRRELQPGPNELVIDFGKPEG